MAVRDALLVLLLAGSRYGFQLHGELAARTGGRRDVNVGQTYATLERLTRQGLVEPAGSTSDGLPLHRLTRDGRAAADAWLSGSDAPGADPWDETVDRVLIVGSLPATLGRRAEVLAAERARWTARLREAHGAATESAGADTSPPSPAVRLRALAAGAEAARSRAALSWLGEVADVEPDPLESSAERPRRGRRPARRTATESGAQPSASASA